METALKKLLRIGDVKVQQSALTYNRGFEWKITFLSYSQTPGQTIQHYQNIPTLEVDDTLLTGHHIKVSVSELRQVSYLRGYFRLRLGELQPHGNKENVVHWGDAIAYNAAAINFQNALKHIPSLMDTIVVTRTTLPNSAGLVD